MADDKVLPHDLDLERSVIVALLLDPATIDAAMATLTHTDFYPENHKQIVGKIFELHGRGEPADLITIGSACNGQRDYLFQLVDQHPLATSITHYAKKVAALAERRRFWRAGQRIAQKAMNGDAGDDPVAAALAEIDIAAGRRRASVTGLKSYDDLKITSDEWDRAQLAPKCVAKDLFYVDVGEIVGAGGVGKTTLILWESVHIILGRPLYGHEVVNPGKVMFLTAEDRRDRLVARLREICRAMCLNEIETGIVRDNLLIVDVVGEGRKLVKSEGMALVVSDLPDQLRRLYAGLDLAMITIDPTASFGADEGKVFESSQLLVDAGRRMCKDLDCCVRYVHHVGQEAARSGIVDMYTGRGGTPLPDGCRMISVLKNYKPENAKQADRPPAGCMPSPDSSLFALYRPKLTYSPPGLPVIWLKRTGFDFEYYIAYQASEEQKTQAEKTQVLALINSKLAQGIKLTRNNLERDYLSEMHGMTRVAVGKAVGQLLAEGRLTENALPPEERVGQRKTFLEPIPRHQ